MAVRLEEEDRRNKGGSRGHQEGVRDCRVVTGGKLRLHIRAREAQEGRFTLMVLWVSVMRETFAPRKA